MSLFTLFSWSDLDIRHSPFCCYRFVVSAAVIAIDLIAIIANNYNSIVIIIIIAMLCIGLKNIRFKVFIINEENMKIFRRFFINLVVH